MTENTYRTYHKEAPLRAHLERPRAPGLREVRLLVELFVCDTAEALRRA